MLLLLDTHIILWAAYEPQKLSEGARALIEDEQNTLLFSAASVWEVSIKSGLGRSDFTVDARILARALREHGYQELPVTAAHAAAVADLPGIHHDPFDRVLVAKARVEGITLLSADASVIAYGTPVISA